MYHKNKVIYIVKNQYLNMMKVLKIIYKYKINILKIL